MGAGVLIVGTGMAGVTVARELRKLNTEIPLTLVSADGGGFYSKPNISNALAAGKAAAQLLMSPRETLATQLKAEIHAGVHVNALRPERKSIETSMGDIAYEQLVIAVGAQPIRLPIEGDGAADVLSVNHLDHYAIFRHVLEGRQKVALLGAGLIGCEFANDLRVGGFDVEVFDLAPQALGRLLPPQTAAFFRQKLEAVGVRFHFESSISRVDKVGAAYRLTDNHGREYSADLVLSAVGLKPEVSLAKAAGLAVNRGIVVDRRLACSRTDTQSLQRSASADFSGIYAVGDCMEVEGLNLPFILPIMQQARALAKTLADTVTELSYPAMPVAVKTPACPTVVCPPPAGAKGMWREEITNESARSIFVDANETPLGFCLLGAATSERQALAARMPVWL